MMIVIQGYNRGMSIIRGDRILLERRSSHINQGELAAAVGVNPSYISKIESGKAGNVGINVINAIADALGVSVAYLLGLSDDPLSGVEEEDEDLVIRESSVVYDAMGTTERRIIELLPRLSDSDKFLILQTVERLANNAPHVIG